MFFQRHGIAILPLAKQITPIVYGGQKYGIDFVLKKLICKRIEIELSEVTLTCAGVVYERR